MFEVYFSSIISCECMEYPPTKKKQKCTINSLHCGGGISVQYAYTIRQFQKDWSFKKLWNE